MAITIAVATYVIVQSLRMIGMLGTTGQRSVIARLPMAAVYVAVPLGYLLTMIFLPIWSWKRMKRLEALGGGMAAEPVVVAERERTPAET